MIDIEPNFILNPKIFKRLFFAIFSLKFLNLHLNLFIFCYINFCGGVSFCINPFCAHASIAMSLPNPKNMLNVTSNQNDTIAQEQTGPRLIMAQNKA